MIQKLEQWFMILVLFYTSGAVWVALSPTDVQTNPTAGNSLLLGLELVIYGGVMFFTALNLKRFLETAWHVKAICLLMVYAVASTAWSGVPTFTLRRSLVMTGTTVIGIYFASRFSLRQQLRLLCWTFFLIAVASILMVLMPPHLGIESTGSHLGSWRGAYIQKNYLGRYMTLGCLCFYFLEGEKPYIRWGGLGLCGSLVVLSQSKSAWAFLLILMCAIPFFWFLRLSLNRLIPTLLALGTLISAVLYVVLININALLGLLGRDLTFSGRTTLWAMLWQKFLQHKWLGYGFGGFWPVEYISIWTQTVSWFPLHAHSGYFDLLLALGFVGMAIFVYLFIRTIWHSVAYLRHGNTRESLWPLTLLGFVFLYNLSEVTLLHESSLFWIVLTAVASVVAMASAENKRTAPAIARQEAFERSWRRASYPQPGVAAGLSARKAY